MKKESVQGRFKKVGKSVSSILNPRKWADYDRVKENTLLIKDTAKTLFIPNSKKFVDSFDSVVERLGLTEEKLLQKQRSFLRLAFLAIFLALLVAGYAFYQLYHANYHTFFASLSLSAVCCMMAFRYHFWYFQIRQRKLGCTIKEWWKGTVETGIIRR